MPYFFSLLILMAVSLILPANGHASSYERSNRAEPATRAQTPWMYLPLYVLDKKGRLVLVRDDGSRVTSARSPNLNRKQMNLR